MKKGIVAPSFINFFCLEGKLLIPHCRIYVLSRIFPLSLPSEHLLRVLNNFCCGLYCSFAISSSLYSLSLLQPQMAHFSIINNGPMLPLSHTTSNSTEVSLHFMPLLCNKDPILNCARASVSRSLCYRRVYSFLLYQ